MAETQQRPTPPSSFWIISALALVWNLIGVATYLTTVTVSPETLAALPEAERALQTGIPAWVTSAYAIAVFGGVLASIALLLRKGWAVPLFIVSLAAIIVQMSHAFFGTALLSVRGASAAILPLLVVAIGGYLVSYSMSARKRGWIG